MTTFRNVKFADLMGVHHSKNADNPKVKEYAAAIKRGDVLPTIDVDQLSTGQLWVVDGEHRAAAYNVLDREIPANVSVEGAPQRIPCEAMKQRRLKETHKKEWAERRKKGQKSKKTKRKTK